MGHPWPLFPVRIENLFKISIITDILMIEFGMSAPQDLSFFIETFYSFAASRYIVDSR